MMDKLSNKQFHAMLNAHVGVGVMHYKSDDRTITSFEFCISRTGQICFVANGAPITLQITDDDETSTIKVVSQKEQSQ